MTAINRHFPSVAILGISVSRLALNEALDEIKRLVNSDMKSYAVTVNPEFIITAGKDQAFKDILNNANLVLADGVGLVIASRFQKFVGRSKDSLPGTIPGVDLVDDIASICSQQNLSVYFLGGYGQVAQKTAEFLKTKYPKLIVAGFYEGSSKESGDGQTRSEIEKASGRIGATIGALFVAYGHPKQEKWIARNLTHIPVKFAMGVGGAFDVISGKNKKAPVFFSRFGLDWLWRVVIEPTRLPRIIRAVVVFPYRVIRG